MNIGNFTKESGERLDYDIDCSDWLSPGDNLLSINVTIDKPGLTNTRAIITDPFIKLWFTGGVNGVSYQVKVEITTEDDRLKNVEFKIKVKD